MQSEIIKKENVGECSYKLSFKTANDGKTKTVEVYRSDSNSLTADTGSRIATFTLAPNQEHSFTNEKPDCKKTYYYAVRAFDAYGNGSSLVADSDVKVNETVVTETTVITNTVSSSNSQSGTTTTTNSGSGARTVSPDQSQVADEADTDEAANAGEADADAAEDGSVLGATTTTSPSPTTNTNSNASQDGQVLGVMDQVQEFGWLKIGLGLLLLGLVIGLAYVFLGDSNKKTSH